MPGPVYESVEDFKLLLVSALFNSSSWRKTLTLFWKRFKNICLGILLLKSKYSIVKWLTPPPKKTPEDLFSAIMSYVIEGVQCICFKLTFESLQEQKNHKICEEVMTQQAIYEPRS